MQIPYNFEPYFTLPIILNCFLDFKTTGSEMGGESLQKKMIQLSQKYSARIFCSNSFEFFCLVILIEAKMTKLYFSK